MIIDHRRFKALPDPFIINDHTVERVRTYEYLGVLLNNDLRRSKARVQHREQHQDLYMAFVDVTMALDTFNQDLLWNILRKFGSLSTFIAMLQQFHTGMCAQVVMAGSQSSSFPIEARMN